MTSKKRPDFWARSTTRIFLVTAGMARMATLLSRRARSLVTASTWDFNTSNAVICAVFIKEKVVWVKIQAALYSTKCLMHWNIWRAKALLTLTSNAPTFLLTSNSTSKLPTLTTQRSDKWANLPGMSERKAIGRRKLNKVCHTTVTRQTYSVSASFYS